jgi:hypothetical protein
LLIGTTNRIWFFYCIVLLAAVGCAPLAQPTLDSGLQGDGQSAADTLQKIDYLAEHLHAKQMLGQEPIAQPIYVAVLPFVDDSGFREGYWDLRWEMAKLLSAEAEAVTEWRVVPYAAVDQVLGLRRTMKIEEILEVGRTLGADVLFLGTIDNYDMKRLTVGDPLLGGYKSYVGVVVMRVGALRIEDQRDLGMVTAEQELSDRDLGLDLFGKPRKQDVEFAELREFEFGSEPFRKSLLGQATMVAMAEVVSGLEALFQPDELNLDGHMAEVLSANGEEIYINIGGENGLRVGYRFAVHPGLKRTDVEPGQIGVIEVREVIGARLSSVRVLQGAEYIRAGDRLKSLEKAADSP